MGLFSVEKLFGITIRESANDGSDFTNPDADYRRLFLGEDGQLHVKDSAGTVTGIGSAVADIVDIPTADTTTTKVLAPDGAGGVAWRAEAAGGGITFTTVGTTSIGGSFDNPTLLNYLKKVTIASTGLVASIGVGVKGDSNHQFGLAVALMTDNAGAPADVIAVNGGTNDAVSDNTLSNLSISTTARIVTVPLNCVVAAGDYWLVAMIRATTAGYGNIAYSSGTGADKTLTPKAFGDVPLYTPSATSNDYTIYANILR